jgi:hypothetical protein
LVSLRSPDWTQLRLEVRYIVERAQQPATAGPDHEAGQGTVVRVYECEAAAIGGLPAGFSDHSAVDDGDGDCLGTGGRHDGLDPEPHATCK